MSAGLMDAGLSSGTGLVSGLYAAHYLEPALLGAYGIYAVAFTFLGFIPANLYLLPASVQALDAEERSRLAILPESLRYGAILAAATALIIPLAGVLALSEVTVQELLPLALTVALLSLISPLQDHIRYDFHISGVGWRAANVSAVRFVVALAVVVGLHLARVEPTWVPFGALAVATFVSMGYGLWLARVEMRTYHVTLDRPHVLMKSGKALLFAMIVPHASQFVAAGIVASFSTVTAVGYTQAARIVAQPIHVAAMGIGQAMSPPLMEAAKAGSRPRSQRARRAYLGLSILFTLAYLPLVGWDVPFNPMATLVPAAYELEGLVLISAMAILAVIIGHVPLSELAGAQRSHELISPIIYGAIVQMVFTAAFVTTIGAYTIPIGSLLNGAVSAAMGLRRSNRLFDR